MSTPFAYETVERLVCSIIAGEAVFFVGAGFSLDSEPNTSVRLIRRLISRFAAITEYLDRVRPAVSSAAKLRKGLCVTFELGEPPLSSEEMVADNIVRKLSQTYYNINDWICSAFTILLPELEKFDAAAFGEIYELEARLLTASGPGKTPDDIRLDTFNCKELLDLNNDAGKALFLETMGFRNDKIWMGSPRDLQHEKAARSYGDRIRDRQRTIIRLAREGLAPLILTTNFDLLLEGAGRAAGFEIDDPRKTDLAKPAANYDRLLVVAGPTDFIKRGSAYRAALLLKIHGCVFRYRQERASTATLAKYLPSMVFTFREIQNWRRDSWSRDLVSTLLRTKSIVLCGYSGADPVVHDTFRTVYEEILANRPFKLSESGENTRAFFTGAVGKAEFAGVEILRAGSRAAGLQDQPLYDHPNYLPVHIRKEPGKELPFPTMDELFVWIYHRSLRQMQLNALRSDLGRIAVMLLHRSVAPGDIDEICRLFEQQCKSENAFAEKWDEKEPSRQKFQQITAWTNHFHVTLLREFALMETVARNQRCGMRIHEFRASGYYFALHDRPGWGAWGAVVELALRQMASHGKGKPASAACSTYPVAEVTSQEWESTRTAIVLCGPGLNRLTSMDVPGLYRRIHEWRLMEWLGDGKIPRGTPEPKDVWEWALAERDSQSPGAWFGEPDEYKSESQRQDTEGATSRTVQADVSAPGQTRV